MKEPDPALDALAKARSTHDHAMRLLANAETLMRAGEHKRAIEEYRAARRDVLSLSSVPADLAERFAAVFSAIREGMRAVEKPKHAAVLDRHILLQLEREKHALDKTLRENDMGDAMRTYKRMRLLVAQMHDRGQAEAAANKLIEIHRIIKQISSHGDDRRLSRTVP